MLKSLKIPFAVGALVAVTTLAGCGQANPPNFLAVGDPGSGVLNWRGGAIYENTVYGRPAGKFELTKASESATGGMVYEFRVIDAERQTVPAGHVFRLTVPLSKRVGGIGGGNMAFCEMCVPGSTTFLADYYYVSPT